MLMATGSEPAVATGGEKSGPGDVPAFGRPSRAQRLRAAGNLANLSTLAGLVVARLGGCALRRGPDGLILAEGYRLRFPVAGAFTIGDVVITAHAFAALQRQLPRLLAHEERHSWQYFWCFGLPFFLLYTAAMGWSVLRTGDRAARNIFERRAGLADGGYPDRPVIPLTAQARRTVAWLRQRSPSRPRSS